MFTRVLDQDFLYIDPKLADSGSLEMPKNRPPFSEAIVFMVSKEFNNSCYEVFF